MADGRPGRPVRQPLHRPHRTGRHHRRPTRTMPPTTTPT
nr:MAG TPA: hypothetical protein [Caudoviricetes sp.]